MKGWVPKSAVCPSKPREDKLFGLDIPGFCRDIPELAHKFEKKKVVFNFFATSSFSREIPAFLI